MPTAELAAGIFSGGPSGNWFSKFANAEALQRQKTTFASQLYTCSSLPLAALSSIAICYPHMMKTRPQVQKKPQIQGFFPAKCCKRKEPMSFACEAVWISNTRYQALFSTIGSAFLGRQAVIVHPLTSGYWSAYWSKPLPHEVAGKYINKLNDNKVWEGHWI